MGFKGNSSDTPVVQETKLYTGLANLKVVAINPTKAQLEELGYKPQNDPVYTSKEGDVRKVRIDLYLANSEKKIRAKVAFFLEDKLRANKDNSKAEWINKFGRVAWGTPEAAPTELKWFDHTTAVRSRIGEADLHGFLINWLNVSPTDEARLETLDSILNGNVAELRALLKAYPDNEVKVLLTVKDGKYQSVYSKYFDRATNKRTTYWESHIKGQAESGYPIKEDYQNDLTFKEWTEPVKSSDAPEGANTAAEKSGADDDPF